MRVAGQMLAASTPSDGAVLAQAPRTLALTFAHPVVLQTVAITGPNAEPVRYPDPDIVVLDKRFAKYKIGNTTLAAGAYEARWTAAGQGHNMNGVVRFTVQ